MMKKLSAFSVGHPVSMLMLVLAVVLLGWISFRRLGIDLFPDLSSPRLFIELQAGERPPEEIESMYAESLEGLAIRQRGAEDVTSVIKVGAALLTVEYSWNTDMDEAFLNLQKAAADFAQSDEDVELSITQYDPNAEPIMTLALSHPGIGDLSRLQKTAEDYIGNELVRVEGIAGVDITGGMEKEVIVLTDDYLLEAYGLTVNDLDRRISGYTTTASGGEITEMGIRYTIRGVSAIGSIADIEGIILTWKEPAGQDPGSAEAGRGDGERAPVFLREVADVSLRNSEPENIVRRNGERCIGIAVYKEMKYNTVKATDNLREALERIGRALPGYELAVVRDQGRFIRAAIDEVGQTLLAGILLAVVVLYVFLRRIGTTAIISISIPVSIIATFNLMYFNGLTLNIMTLGGLALGAGMLVDNAIVVVESIVRKIESGMPVREAAAVGTSQVGGAITASTITTIVVFLPIVYIHGAAGELFRDQAWTVAFSLLSSLAVAILVIPMLAGRFLRRRAVGQAGPPVEFDWYARILAAALRRRRLVIAAAALLVVAAALLVPRVGSEFMPSSDTEEYSVDITLPEGTDLSRTGGVVSGIESALRDLFGGNIESVYSTAGPVSGAGTGEDFFTDENTATIRIRIAGGSTLSRDEIMRRIGSAVSGLPSVEAGIIQEQTAVRTSLGAGSAPIVVEIRGDDLDVLNSLSEQVRERLIEVSDLYNVETSLEQGRPQVDVVVDRLRAGLLETDVTQITSRLEDILSGRVAGEWEDDGESRKIRIETPDVSLSSLERVYVGTGERKVRLDEVARLRRGSAPREIHRRDQVRTALVTAHKREGRPFDRAVAEIEERLAAIDVPADYRLLVTGEEQRREEEFGDLRFALILSVILVYMVLASQFESLLHPFAILLTIPLAGVGAVLVFFILGRSFNMMAYIGIIMLAGIAVNDSIILIDAVNRLRREGSGKSEAIIGAGRMRIRPIVMTSATTILALFPLTLGIGEGAALRSPMALAVIGGLVTSTALTLFVIPCVYSVLDRSE